MPYITEERRDQLDRLAYDPYRPGDLNYAITRLVVRYLGGSYSYEKYNDVIGVLECAKLELYRRMVAPYEDRKMKENGDVY